ncbi:CU044_2847 family protein [Streptomyces pinistramenti]|uniref:CU044_2847 family protein n=1 Tax=Streptomyces pinistramenti TaxID=2884812 RepID=UPI001D068921|nr:CU044_2847 family protein [Streptomyces pinistramenti]MCB5908405.1 hypothetical protein [Streptomyces pinistramenti]
MGDVALSIDDGTVVWLRATPAAPAEGHRPAEGDGGQQHGSDSELELPEGFGSALPVSVDSRLHRTLTRSGEVLEEALRPLGSVLGQIHRSIADSSHHPDEVTVQFGVTLGSDLKLGVFSGKGDASFTVSATWKLGSDAGETGGTTP